MYTTKKLNITFRGSPVVQIKYNPGNYSREEIKKISQKFSNDMANKNFLGRVMVSLKYPEGWRSGYLTNVGEPISLYTHSDSDLDDWEEPNNYPEFRIYVLKTPNKEGGHDFYNDCLYYALRSRILKDMEKEFPSPESLKKFCGLDRKDKIGIDQIPKIEEKLKKYKITVTGDHIYTSTNPSKFEIFLKLKNEHYFIDKDKTFIVKGIAYEEKQPLVYKECKKDPYKVHTFNGVKVRKISKKLFSELRSESITSQCILVKVENGKSLKQTYLDFIQDADILKEVTKGKVNLYKTGSVKKAALKLFLELNGAISPDQILQDEAEWIDNATFSAMIWANEYKGKVYKYDVCSMYGSIMRDQKFFLPIKRGTFKKITQVEFDSLKFFPYGIYRVEIKNDNYRLFRINKKNYYTHYDLTTARELNLEIKLIEDGKANVLEYDKECKINGNKVFQEYVDFLFELKKKNLPRSKQILNVLWGALCQKDKIRLIYDEDSDEKMEIRSDKSIFSIKPINVTKIQIKIIKSDSMYETKFARLAPFIIARGRRMIANIMKPHIESIVRVHTDGFISKKKIQFNKEIKKSNRISIDDVILGKEIGNLKYEGYCENVIVHNNIRIEGEFLI